MKSKRIVIFQRLRQHIKFKLTNAITIGLLSMAMTIISSIQPYLYKVFIDEVMTEKKAELLIYVISLMVGAFLLRHIVSIVLSQNKFKIITTSEMEIKNKLLNKILESEINIVDKVDAGKIYQCIEEDSAIIGEFYLKEIIDYACTIAYTIVYLCLTFSINSILASISILFIPITLFWAKLIGKRFNECNASKWLITSGIRNYIFETIQNWKEIKNYNLNSIMNREYSKLLQPELVVNNKWMSSFATNQLFIKLKNQFLYNILLYCIGGYLVLLGSISVGSLLMLINYATNLGNNIDSIVSSHSRIISNTECYNRVFSALEKKGNQGAVEGTSYGIINIQFENVSFICPNEKRELLSNVSYCFENGKKYLIVGKSGAGKSTLIKLMLGLIRPSNGIIRVNEKLMQNIKQRDYLSRVGAVLQESSFFNLSIKENMQLVNPDISNDALMQAIKDACLDEFVESLPEKLDTVIGERGVKLSGGQKQRLAIARLLIQNPQLIILDEATNALDEITETKLLGNLFRLFGDKTIIIISHNPRQRIKFDKIIKINNGMISYD